MQTGIITKVHEDLSGFIQASDRAHYRFYADGLWGFQKAAPQAGEEVVFEINATGRTAKGIRRLQRASRMAADPRRWIPALITGQGLATTRYVPIVYLPFAPDIAKLPAGSPILVRIASQRTGAAGWVRAMELQSLPEDVVAPITAALQADSTKAIAEQQQVDVLLATKGAMQTEADFLQVLELLRLRDAYTNNAPTVLLDATSELATRAQALGYGDSLTPRARLSAVRQQTEVVDPALMDPALLAEYTKQRLSEIQVVTTPEVCQELLQLYHLIQRSGNAVFPVDQLQQLRIKSEYQLTLWQAGLPLPLPAHTQLVPETLSARQLGQYVPQRLAELNPVLTAAAGQEIQDLFRIGRQKYPTIFTAEFTTELWSTLEIAEEHRLALWQQGALLPLPHTQFDPSELPGDLLRQYVAQWLDEQPILATEEACQEALKLWLLGGRQGVKLFTAAQLAGLHMDASCQLKLWLAGMAVPLPHTQLDPRELTTSQFDEYATRRLPELNPIQTIEARQELISLYELSQRKQSTQFLTTLLPAVEAEADHHLPLWVTGMNHFIPSTEELVEFVLQQLPDISQGSQLLARCQLSNQAEAVMEAVLARRQSENLPLTLKQVQFAGMSPAYGDRLLELLTQYSPEGQLIAWWLDGTLQVNAAPLTARHLLAADPAQPEQDQLLLKFRKKPGSALAVAHELRQQIIRGQLTAGATHLLSKLTAIVRAQGRSRWQVDYWAQEVVQDLQHDTPGLPMAEQLEWWLKGLGTEPSTALFQQLAPTLSDELLSQLWRSISTPGAKALVKSLLPWVAQAGTEQWLRLTLQELKERRGVFYTQACQSLYEKALPRLSVDEQITLWLDRLVGQPADEVLRAYLTTDEEAIRQLLPRLSADATAQLLPHFLRDLAPDSPLTELIMDQLQKHSRESEACTILQQQVCTRLQPMLADDRYLQWWLAGWLPAPEAGMLYRALPMLPPDQQRRLLHHCSPDLLTACGRELLTEVRPELGLLLLWEVTTLLYTGSQPESAARQVLAELLARLQPVAHVYGWLTKQLPALDAQTLAASLVKLTETQRQELTQRCEPGVLISVVQLLPSLAGESLSSAKYLVCKLAEQQDPAAQELVASIMARLPTLQQVDWWLVGKALTIPWPVIQTGLEQEDAALRLSVARAAGERQLPALLAYLPTASSDLIEELVQIFMQESTWDWDRSVAGRTRMVRCLAEQLCSRYRQEPQRLQGYLLRLQQRCHNTRNAYSYRPEQFADPATIQAVVAHQLAPLLDESELLDYWQHNLLGYFPLVSLESIAGLVAESSQPGWLLRLSTEARLPAAIVQAWKGLSGLLGATTQQLQATAAAHNEALAWPDLLRGLTPWLVRHLSAEQLEELWVQGYPVPQPAGWSSWTIQQRLITAINYGRQRLGDLPVGLAPTGDELLIWLAEQYWEEADEAEARQLYQLLRDYQALAIVDLPPWSELEDELLLRCAGVVVVRLWMSMPPDSRQRTFNYYAFRRGYSRLKPSEQRDFLRVGQPYLQQLARDFKAALHLRRRYLLRQQEGVSVYRICLAHCFCPQEGYLTVELAEGYSTRPSAYPEAAVAWNEKFLQEPWSGCPVIVHVDDQTRELLQLQGLEAALTQYPLLQSRAQVTFQRDRNLHGTQNNPLDYWEDITLHDELSEYLTDLSQGATRRAVVLLEKLPVSATPRPQRAGEPSEARKSALPAGSDESVSGWIMQPRQTVLYLVSLQEEIVCVWAPQFANSNRATYLFRASVVSQEQAFHRLTDLLQRVGNVRSALLAPGLASHRLRRHLGYVCNVRGQRGHGEAFERWQARLDKALYAGPSQQHPYDPDSDFTPEELTALQREQPAPRPAAPETTPPRPKAAVTDLEDGPQASDQAHRLLQRLRQLNATFLLTYSG